MPEIVYLDEELRSINGKIGKYEGKPTTFTPATLQLLTVKKIIHETRFSARERRLGVELITAYGLLLDPKVRLEIKKNCRKRKLRRLFACRCCSFHYSTERTVLDQFLDL